MYLFRGARRGSLNAPLLTHIPFPIKAGLGINRDRSDGFQNAPSYQPPPEANYVGLREDGVVGERNFGEPLNTVQGLVDDYILTPTSITRSIYSAAGQGVIALTTSGVSFSVGTGGRVVVNKDVVGSNAVTYLTAGTIYSVYSADGTSVRIPLPGVTIPEGTTFSVPGNCKVMELQVRTAAGAFRPREGRQFTAIQRKQAAGLPYIHSFQGTNLKDYAEGSTYGFGWPAIYMLMEDYAREFSLIADPNFAIYDIENEPVHASAAAYNPIRAALLAATRRHWGGWVMLKGHDWGSMASFLDVNSGNAGDVMCAWAVHGYGGMSGDSGWHFDVADFDDQSALEDLMQAAKDHGTSIGRLAFYEEIGILAAYSMSDARYERLGDAARAVGVPALFFPTGSNHPWTEDTDGTIHITAGALPAFDGSTPAPSAIEELHLSGSGGAGGFTYSGTYEPDNVSPVPAIVITAEQGSADVASEAADTISAGAFSGAMVGLAPGAYTVRATARGAEHAQAADLTVTTDTTPPTVSSLTQPGPGTYLSNQTLDFVVTYSEAVLVQGLPRIVLNVGGATKYAGYIGGTGTASVAFQYTIIDGDADADGVQRLAGVDLNGGSIRDPAGNDAVHTALTAQTLTGVLVDGNPVPPLNDVLAMNSPLYDLRADRSATITTAGAAISAWTSGEAAAGQATQATAANQPTHSSPGSYVSFTSTGVNDAAGDFLNLPALVSRYNAAGTGSRRGVAYMLLRFAALPTWDTFAFRVGRNSATYAFPSRNAFYLRFNASGIVAVRGDGTSSSDTGTKVLPAVNEWLAVAFVLNDSRATDISRLYLKTKPGGTYATMNASVTIAAKAVGYANDAVAQINRATYAGSTSDASGVFHLHSCAFDGTPHETDAEIELNLDRLLLRV